MLEITLTVMSIAIGWLTVSNWWLTVSNWRKSREIRRMRARIECLTRFRDAMDEWREAKKQENDVLNSEYLTGR